MKQVVVVKIGGSLQGAGAAALAAGLTWAMLESRPVVLVHGGGPRISEALSQAGVSLPFVNGLRKTTPEAMEIVDRVLSVEVNGEIARELAKSGFPARGMGGQHSILCAAPISEMGRTGQVIGVNTGAVELALKSGEIPVIAPVGADDQGSLYNVNADLAAAAIAGSLSASHIVYLTDVAGIYEDFGAGKLLAQTDATVLTALLQQGCFSAGMIPKVNAVLGALDAGVPRAFVVDGRDRDAVVAAMQNRELPQGTVVNGKGEVA